MTATTMHFGPEWMRTKQAPSRPAPSPPLATSTTPAGASSYSALVTPASQAAPERRDVVHPFRYSKEDMLRIYKEGGGKGGLGLEVERWEGIVREVGYDPVGLKEMGEGEKKIFAGPLNSEIRRRSSVDHLSPLSVNTSGERPKLNLSHSGASSPMRDRLGNYMGRRRDSTDQPPSTLPRKVSLTSLQGPLASPRDGALPSPRARIGVTPGFDGVLNDSWTARRRASEGALKAGGRNERDGFDQGDSRDLGIKEEEEPPNPHNPHHLKEASSDSHVNGSGSQLTRSNEGGQAQNSGQQGQESIASAASTFTNGTENAPLAASAGPTTSDPAVAGPPPGLVDLASVEWSYLDPQRTVQGPFRADTMQKWYDDGYFTPDLLMRRTHIDTEWTPVGELLRRAGTTRLFLTPIPVVTVPPGLPRRPDPLLDVLAQDQQYGSPFQPVPTRSLRSSTLDPYLHNGSSASNSPSSSFSAGRFGNGSPDPAAFSGRIGSHMYHESPMGTRANAFGLTQDVSHMDPHRRATLDELDPALHSSTKFSGRVGTAVGIGFDGLNGLNPSPSEPVGGFGAGLGIGPTDSGVSANGHSGTATLDGNDYTSSGGYANHDQSRLIGREPYAKPVDEARSEAQPGIGTYNNSAGVPYQSNGLPYSHAAALAFASQQDNRALHSFTPISERQAGSSHGGPMAQQQRGVQHSFIPPNSVVTQSPWLPQDTTPVHRSGPFEVEYPTSRNTVVPTTLAPSQSFPQANVMQPTTVNDQSPWFAASQGSVDQCWTADPNSLTVANLGQHNLQEEQKQEQQRSVVGQSDAAQAQPVPVVVEDLAPERVEQPPASPAAPEVEQTRPQKTRRKSNVQLAPSQQLHPNNKSVTAPTASAKPPSPIVAPEPKPVWSTEEDSKKSKQSGPTMTLREIQEAETKKLEARKAAERERAARAAAVAVTSPPSEEIQPFTASWGLPTSQAGAARANAAPKETSGQSSANASSPTPPVWTGAAKTPVVKKSMKEIQEEEEKRKKMAAKEKETVAAAARRAYSESTAKTPPTLQTGGAWTTVGSAGKTSGVATPARPTVASSPSAKVVPSVSTTSVTSVSSAPPRAPNPVPPSRSTPAIAAAAKIVPSVSKAEDLAVGPSLDFLKWLGDSLKGLHSSVNLEEITSMLLSFPLDADSSTMEIISDLIYANSTTLDGRRFASEFVAKRKADSRSGAAPAAGNPGKVLSIADVVKAQPKPAQNEWGGFKVVNKKKKGARA